MKSIYASLPTAISGAARLYAAYILVSADPDFKLILGAFFLSLGIYSLDRAEDFEDGLKLPVLFTLPAP